MNGLMVDHQKCTGCGMCELACSTNFDSTGFNPRMSAIQVHVVGTMEADIPLVCMQCEDAPCAEACPEEAFYRDSSTGALLIDQETCINCGACVKACPYGALYNHELRATPIKCDLCGGSPLCVEYCVAGALALSPEATWPRERREAHFALIGGKEAAR